MIIVRRIEIRIVYDSSMFEQVVYTNRIRLNTNRITCVPPVANDNLALPDLISYAIRITVVFKSVAQLSFAPVTM
jgi:hypothetical protein